MIDLYILKITDLPDPRDHEEWRSLFPAGKYESILRFMVPEDRKRSAGAWLLLSHGLRKRGLNPGPEAIFLGEKGKPLREDICFSLAHSGDYSVCVLSDREIGVDIEKVRAFNGSLAEKSFSDLEIRRMEEEKDPRKKDRLFVRAWSFRESYVKKTGEGLGFGISRLVPATSQDGPCILVDGEPDTNVHFTDYFTDGHQIMICSEEENEDVRRIFIGARYLC